MVTVPALTGVTRPVEVTVAIAVLLLVQVPPAGVPVKDSGVPIHVELPPEIEAPDTTVIVRVALQPPELYVMTTEPAAMPLTTPELLMVAMDGLLLLHVPPPGVAVSDIVVPIQTLLLPLITALAFTVTDL